MGKRAFAVGSQNIYTSTSTAANMWPQLASIGGPILDVRVELNMNESGLFRFKIGFDDISGPRVEDSYYRLLGDSFIDPEGVFGGIYSNLSNQVNGRMFIEHEDFGQESDMTIFNNAFKATRIWASILEPLVKFQGGRNDMEYSVPGQIHVIYIDPTCVQKKIDFRTIGYGDGLEGTEMLLFNLEEMEDIIFTQSNDTAINVGDDFFLGVTNNFTDIFSGDTRINYTWVDPNNNSISNDTNFTFNNATINDTGIYNIQVEFLGCPVFSLPVRVTMPIPLPVKLIAFNATLQNNESVKLEWSTSSEINNDYFTLEKSDDLEEWQLVDKINGAGNSNNTINYTDVDNDPFQGVSYYRLKQTDFDGGTSYSKIRSVELKYNDGIKIFPNPATKLFVIELDDIKGTHIKIVNNLGKEVLVSKFVEGNRMVFDSSKLSSGIYFILITGNTGAYSKKIIIE